MRHGIRRTEFVVRGLEAAPSGDADEIALAINTHWHFDHTDGNKRLGPESTWLVSQQNSGQMMLKDNVINFVMTRIDQAAYSSAALGRDQRRPGELHRSGLLRA